MPISTVDFFKLNEAKFEASGAFDALIDWDSQLFVDPSLLKNCEVPEFSNAHDELLKYFRDTLRLISLSTKEDDRAWRTAKSRLVFQEIGAFGLGYANHHLSGSGMGRGFAEQLVKSLKEIYQLGISDPEVFELLSIFEIGVGPDRISDMTCRILIGRFAAYTERIFRECGSDPEIAMKTWDIAGKSYKLPPHFTKTNYPVLLVPKSILRNLPIAVELDIAHLARHNADVRDRLNKMLGQDWAEMVKEASKEKTRSYLLEDEAELLRELIRVYKETPKKPYDFDSDMAGEFFWREASKEYVDKFPLSIKLSKSPKSTEVIKVVQAICEHFKKLVENNGLWEVLVDDGKRSRRERTTQRLFFAVADGYCKANNIDLSPESNAGVGPVDFKLSRGLEKVIVEIKHSSNPNLRNGYTEQVTAYEKAENAIHAIYLILINGEHDKKINSVFERKNELAKQGGSTPEIITVDGKPKKSASKR